MHLSASKVIFMPEMAKICDMFLPTVNPTLNAHSSLTKQPISIKFIPKWSQQRDLQIGRSFIRAPTTSVGGALLFSFSSFFCRTFRDTDWADFAEIFSAYAYCWSHVKISFSFRYCYSVWRKACNKNQP